MTKRGRSTVTAVLLLASLPLILSLTLLTSPAASSEREVVTLAQEPCPAESVPALVQGRLRCLGVGQKCRRTLDPTFHRYAFHCHKGRLTRPTSFAMRVNVGGHRLAISCRGKGRPTVILESGAGTSSGAWVLLAPKVAKTTRVCSYDRAGLGDSEPRRPPGPVPAAKVVEDLHVLLAGSGIAPPYILGGWSLGGFFIRLYAKRYPAEVVGLVGVDGTPFGIPGDPFLNRPGQPPIDLIGGPGISDSYYFAAAGAELAASPDLGSRPLVLLTHGLPVYAPADFEAMWVQSQKQVARFSTSSILVRADRAGHAIQFEVAELTAEAFRLVIQAVRRSAPLPVCAATRLPALDCTCLDPTSEQGQRTRNP
jgi:pimeloyl-ACP methyl ester carboxylesterase